MGLVSSNLDCILTIDTKSSWKVPIQSSDVAITEFDMNAKDPLSKEKWRDLYQKAKDHFLPSYAVALVEYKYPSKLTKIKIYDGVTFYKSHLKNPKQFTKRKRKIRNIHYLAAKCFDFDANFLKKDIKSKSLIFSDFFPENYKEMLGEWLDTVNYLIAEDPQSENKMGKLQFVVADYLSRSPEEKGKQEAIRWLWCSAKRDIEAANDKIIKFFRNGHVLNQNDDMAQIWTSLHEFYEKEKEPKLS